MIDCDVLKVDPENGEVTVMFTMENAKPTNRTFKDMKSAAVFGTFLAAQCGTREPSELFEWLRKRGFDPLQSPGFELESGPGDELGSGPVSGDDDDEEDPKREDAEGDDGDAKVPGDESLS